MLKRKLVKDNERVLRRMEVLKVEEIIADIPDWWRRAMSGTGVLLALQERIHYGLPRP